MSTSADHYPSLRLFLPSAIPRESAATHALIFSLLTLLSCAAGSRSIFSPQNALTCDVHGGTLALHCELKLS